MNGADRWSPPARNEDALAYLQYTSGTTGDPKGVMVSHRNVLYNQDVWLAGSAVTGAPCIVSWVPMYHDMGLVGVLVHSLYTDGTCVLMSPHAFLRNPISWLQAISRYRANQTCAPNFGFDLCARKVRADELKDLDLSSLRVAASGGEPIRAETIQRFVETFEPCGLREDVFIGVLGMAETALVVTCGSQTVAPKVRSVLSSALQDGRVVVANDGEGGTQTMVGSGAPPLDHHVVIVDPATGGSLCAG